MKFDLVSAYAASITRILSWMIVSALIYRKRGVEAFAIFSLVRTTIGLLSYTSLGLAPAMIHVLAHKKNEPEMALPVDPSDVLSYADPSTPRDYDRSTPMARIFVNGLFVSLITVLFAGVVLVAYAFNFRLFHSVPALPKLWDIQVFVFFLGIGLLLRVWSDPSSAVLQSVGHIAFDNSLFIFSEVMWVLLTFVFGDRNSAHSDFLGAHYAFVFSGLTLYVLRLSSAKRACGIFEFREKYLDFRTCRTLVAFGLGVVIAQMADFLYAPTDNILINRLIDPVTVGVYAPAIQIDAGLLMLMTGVGAVLLPYTAIAHAGGEREKVKQYYVRGTVMSTGVLIVAAIGVYFLSPWIFKLWLNDSMPATRAILPLVLIHTVVGGSSAVGRSILLGMGKVKPFTIAVLVAGVLNVAMSFSFVYFLHWGLRGIVLGTILAVVGRCAVWQPWYVLKSLKKSPAQA